MQKKFAKVLLPIALVALSSLPGRAQSSNAAITGVVTDAAGAVVPNTQVVLTNPSTGTKYTVKTDSNGTFRIPNVSPGPGYVVVFTHDGFASSTVKDVYLQVGSTRTQDAKLIAGASTDVEVSAKADEVTLNTTDATIGNNFDIEMVNQLPIYNRTNLSVLFTLQPGVTAGGSVTGARTDQNYVTLDGIDTNDIAAGTTFGGVGQYPPDAIQEFRATVGSPTTNMGTGSGGQYQLVTKSGTNSWHGNLNEYHRDTTTVANSWFNNNSYPTQIARTPLIRNQFGGNLGGPVLHDKLFFFFNFVNSRIVQSSTGTATVPLDSYRNGQIAYINDNAGCTSSSRDASCISTLTSAQVAALDPLAIGFNQDWMSFINSRYPHANDLTGGDRINTGLYRFTQPTPDTSYSYIGRVDYNLTPTQRIYGRFNIYREDAVQSLNRFDTDPLTHPYQDRSYGYMISHMWQLGANKTNQFYYGDNIQKVSFPTSYNPTGINQFSTSLLSSPYVSASSQKRRVPIPEIRDDFNWTVGNHTVSFGGTFKWIKTNSQLVNDFNFVGVGLGGALSTLDSTVRPTNMSGNATAQGYYDSAFALALGRIADVSTNYNYNNNGVAYANGTGENRAYRYFQSEFYIGDTWKATPALTLSYGLRYQVYSVPYEVHGAQSIQNETFDSYFAARIAQTAAGDTSANGVPLITYNLGGKANNAAPLYNPSYKDIAPRFGFSFNPQSARRLVLRGGVGMSFDRTVINAINFVQDQSSYLFQNSITTNYGVGGSQVGLANDPRIGSGLGFTNPNTAPVITRPYTPYSDLSGVYNNQFNYIVDPKLKTPYAITASLGMQLELPSRFILKADYVGRFGRRLLAQADASQLLDFPDKTSGQFMSQAFANVETQLRNGASYRTVTTQPWFENVPNAHFYSPTLTNTQAVAGLLGSYLLRGDIADSIAALVQNGWLTKPNVGLASQFAGNTFMTNKGNSSYNALLVTLSKNPGHGLQFDFNYTYGHSVDNVSANANTISSSSGTGQICDATNIDRCRGNSDFDITHTITGNFIYSLPFGHGRAYAASVPRALDYVIGGWDFSGIGGWRTGTPMTPVTDAFLAGYANNAPMFWNGDKHAIRQNIHKDESHLVQQFADPDAASNAFTPPTGLDFGSRNIIRAPGGFNMDLGLAKTFPIWNRVVFKFRADAFNIFNHPIFNGGNMDMNSSNTFGQITSTYSSARVAQFAGRIEF